ncbi:MAG: hypothetical protein IJZ16_01280 [Clostridia bacterium]|nr:hypothetical protein [Clostridia bacterium]
MKKLIKTINGQSCEVYAISHHNRLMMGEATPSIEVYEDSVEVPTIGTNNIRYKSTYFSIAICPNVKMNMNITAEAMQGITFFDLYMLLPRKDGVYVPFTLYGVSVAEISPEQWTFEITDQETVQNLLAL